MSSMENECGFEIEKLTSTNYSEWACDAKMMLMARGLKKFIEEENSVPGPHLTSTELEQFDLRKDKALACLYFSISRNIQPLIRDCNTAHELWVKLKNTFVPKTVGRKIQLRRKFLNIALKPDEDMLIFICRVLGAAQECQNAGIDIGPQELAFQYMDFLPPEYDMATQRLYQLAPEEFTPDKVAETLIAEYHWLNYRKTNENSTMYQNGAPHTGPEGTRKENCGKLGNLSSKNSSAKKKFWKKKKTFSGNTATSVGGGSNSSSSDNSGSTAVIASCLAFSSNVPKIDEKSECSNSECLVF